MKFIKKVMAVALCAVVALSVMSIPTKAEAAEKTRYEVRFDDGKWWYAVGPDYSWAAVSGLNAAMHDGDTICIDGVGTPAADLKPCELNITKRIGELAVTNNATAIVNASAGVDYAYGVGNGTLVVNGDVNLFTASNLGVGQVNGNVNELVVTYPIDYKSTENDPKFAVQGLVGKATVKVNSEIGVFTIYNIAKNKCVPDKYGILWLNDGEYTKDPSGATTPAAVAPAATPASTPTTGEKKLDDVPKTGSTGVATSMAFFAMAAVLAVSAVVVKRKEQ